MLHFFEEIYHFHCGHCAVYALVAGLGACTFYSLLDVFGGEYAEGYGYTGLHAYLGDAFGGFGAYIVKVAAFCEFFCCHGDFEGARYPGYGEVFVSCFVADEAVYAAAEEFAGDEFVEAGYDDGDFHVFGGEFSF